MRALSNVTAAANVCCDGALLSVSTATRKTAEQPREQLIHGPLTDDVVRKDPAVAVTGHTFTWLLSVSAATPNLTVKVIQSQAKRDSCQAVEEGKHTHQTFADSRYLGQAY